MSTGLHPPSQVEAPPRPVQQAPGHSPRVGQCSTFVTPSKRSDDDIQFISSKPVKRRKISEQRLRDPGPQESILPSLPPAPVTLASAPTNDPRDTDRRVSTGMVGLPSDISAIELSCALRGVSLPMLENFVLDQPLRKPRPLSPPELSPKQLPQTIPPGEVNMHHNSAGPRGINFQGTANNTACCLPVSETPAKQEVVSNLPNTSEPNTNHLHVLNTPVSQNACLPTSGSTGNLKATDMRVTAMPPPQSPRPEVPSVSESNTHDTCRGNASKQPCQVCARLRQQANTARAQGLPMMNASVPQHLLSHMSYHHPYGQHVSPHMMAIAANHMHQFAHGFAPFMMPVSGNAFAALPSQLHTSAQQGGHPSFGPGLPPPSEKANDATQPTGSPPPPPASSAAAKSGTPSSPVKPPASLIQPTYRKRSPNLIVDVAETCQEKFPFEEVAKRHNTSVDKVFDVFAAIIQVPLLRCPTDRRRAGKLATARVREYTKAKKDIQEPRAQGGSGSNSNLADSTQDRSVSTSDIAHRLGQVDFPEGFRLGG